MMMLIWVIITSDNGLSPMRCQAITWTNVDLLSIGPMGTNFSEIRIKIKQFSFTKMNLKMPFANWRPFCLSLNMLRQWSLCKHDCSWRTSPLSAFSGKKMFNCWFRFHWSRHLWFQMTQSHFIFRQCLCPEMAIGHYLKQWQLRTNH